jgi:FkbM family methyltransferase
MMSSSESARPSSPGDGAAAGRRSLPLRRNAGLLHYVMWLVQLLKGLSSRGKDFVILTPPSSRTQRVLCKRSRRILVFRLRSLDDWFTMHQVFGVEEYDLKQLTRYEAIKDRYETLLASGRVPVIVDCGANIGLSVLYFSTLFPRAAIVALEPEDGNVRLARENARGCNATILHAAISTTDGSVDVEAGGRDNAFRTVRSADGRVASLSVPSVLQQTAVSNGEPFIIKIDIEGFESTLFESHTEWIQRFDLLIIELHDWLFPGQATSGAFLRAIARERRDFVFYHENVFSVRI